ncbi:258_t:CDS:1, partial [Racocetra persica]
QHNHRTSEDQNSNIEIFQKLDKAKLYPNRTMARMSKRIQTYPND